MPEQAELKHREKRAAVMDELKRQGIRRVNIPFEGSDYDVMINDVAAVDSEDKRVSLVSLSSPCNHASSLQDDLEEIASDTFDAMGDNWCSDVGGEGTITIDAETGTIHAEVNRRFEEFATTEWEWKP